MTILSPVTALTVKLPAQRYRVAISCIAQMRCADRTEHDRSDQNAKYSVRVDAFRFAKKLKPRLQ